MARKITRPFPGQDGYDPGIPTRKGYLSPVEHVAQAGSGRVGPHTIGADPADVPTKSVPAVGVASPSERLWDQEG